MPQQGFDEDEIVTPAPSDADGFGDDEIVQPAPAGGGSQAGSTDKPPGKSLLTPAQQAAQARMDAAIKKNAPPASQIGEFGTTLWEDVSGMAKGLWQVANEDPRELRGQVVEMAKGLTRAQLDEFKKAHDFAKQGDWKQASIYSGFGALPILGPASADIAEDVNNGHYGRASARLVELLGPELFRFFKIGPAVSKIAVTPELEQALTETEQAGVRSTVGQRMRSERLQKGERNLRNFKGSEERASKFFQGQQQELKARGTTLAEQQSPTTAKITASEAGRNIQGRLTQRFNRFKSAADTAYDDFRRQAALGKKTLQNGWKPVLDADGNVIGREPVMKDFETPVDIRELQRELKPVWDDLQGPFQQPAQAQASPGFQKFGQLMHTKDWYMDAVDFDRTLGAIKSVTRDGKNPLLSNRSQGIAKLMVQEGEKALDTAFSGVQGTSPTIKQALERGRRMAREYYDTAEFAKSLGKTPGDVYRRLTQRGLGALEDIKKLRTIAPQELPQLSRTFLEGMIREGSQAGGPFVRMGRMAARFEKLEPEVQDALFGKAQAAEIKRYLNAARYLTPGEGSNTIGKLSQMLHYGPAIGALTELVTGHPLAAAGAAFTYGMTEFIGPRISAGLLLQPGTPRLLTSVIQLPLGSKVWTRAAQALTVRAMAMEQDERQQEEERQRAAGQAPAAQARPAPTPTTPAAAAAKPSPVGRPVAAPEGQEAAPSQAPTRAPGTAAGAARGAVLPTPGGGTRPELGATQTLAGGSQPSAPEPPARPARPGRPAPQPGGMARWQPLFQQIGQSVGVPPGLLHTVAQLESSGNPNAVGSSGERGLMQLMPATARSLKVDPSDPQQAIRGAATLLRHLMQKYRGDIAKVLAAYNEGETAFDRRMRRGLPLPSVTQQYVRHGLALLRAGGQPVQTASLRLAAGQ